MRIEKIKQKKKLSSMSIEKKIIFLQKKIFIELMLLVKFTKKIISIPFVKDVFWSIKIQFQAKKILIKFMLIQ